jgi:glycosyltransferase involved in cell wall biosynthesis
MIKKHKIIHVLHAVGGVDISLRTILASIDTTRFDSIVVHGLKDTTTSFLLKDSTKARSFQIDIQREISVFKDMKATWQLVKILKKEKPNLVHAHSAKGGVIARIASLFYSVTVLHTPQAYSFLSKPNGFKRRCILLVERLLKNVNSILLASSNSEKIRGLIEVKYSADRVRLFNNAIQPLQITGSNAFVNSLPKTYIATVGRPSFQKNIESMLRAIAKVKMSHADINLVIMGVGLYSPNLETIKSMIKSLGLQNNVTLVEWQDRQNILEAIAASAFYISTARYEGLPYSVIEAMAVGKALLLTDVDGNRDLVVEGENGFLIKENEESALAEKIIYLHTNISIRAAKGIKSKELFESQHNMLSQIKYLEHYYMEFSSTN